MQTSTKSIVKEKDGDVKRIIRFFAMFVFSKTERSFSGMKLVAFV